MLSPPFTSLRVSRAVDPRDDGPLPDLVSGIMWLATAIAGALVLALPGTADSHGPWMIGLIAFGAVWGCVSIWLGLRGQSMALTQRAAVTAAMLPVVGLALWATGGASSFLQPVLLFTALFIAYFFPPRLAWPLNVLFVATYATPLVYDGHAVAQGYPARVAMFAVAVGGQTLAMRMLKNRLLRAEAIQRRVAELDSLTGLANRRSFDLALAGAAERCGLVLFDFDGFKAINDEHGHPTGDAVLRAVADSCRSVVRDSDCLARIGGDEFAVVAPGAGGAGVMRLVDALGDAIDRAKLPPGVGPVAAAFGWATAPEDSTQPDLLVARADRRLLERKRERRAPKLRRRVGFAAQ